MNAIAAGNEMLVHLRRKPCAGRARRSRLGRLDGRARRRDPRRPPQREPRAGPPGAFVVFARNRAYGLEHLGRAEHHASWLNGRLGRCVPPVVCLGMRRHPHRRNGVWITGVECLAEWLEDHPAESSR
ncbi:MAG TPA: hypothetical protein VK915_03750 [Gaiellaceae bacterium]|nr:hypothetical protein [Gaiellaceae bacterium]